MRARKNRPPPSAPSHDDQPVAGPSTHQLPRPPEKRRLLPARSRRGGPGVGSTPIDDMILDTLRRRHDAEPLIPPETRFLLTTDTTRALSVTSDASTSSRAVALNRAAEARYFDRLDVIEALRAQREIETPEFCQLEEHAAVGGRFRARVHEDDGVDTSDAAYEKRHRKYEAFEKRQRLREKEKLKHEHYKLKERIEQLRAMDASAFISIDVDDYDHEHEPPPTPLSLSMVVESEDYMREAERRKAIMLDVAVTLEDRYKTLLDPPGAIKAFESASRAQTVTNGVSSAGGSDEEGAEEEDPEGGDTDDVEADEGEVDDEQDDSDEREEEPEDGEQSEEDAEDGVEELPPPPPPPPPQTTKLRIRLPPRASLPSSAASTPQPPHKFVTTASAPLPAPRKSLRSRPALSSNGDALTAPSAASLSPSLPLHKRQRLPSYASDRAPSVAASAPLSQSLPVLRDWRKCDLYVFALRSGPALSRKPQRHNAAFGAKLPEFSESEFEIPYRARVGALADELDDEDEVDELAEDVDESRI